VCAPDVHRRAARGVGDDALSVVAGNPTPGIFDTLELIGGRRGVLQSRTPQRHQEYSANPATAAQLVATGKADVCSLSVEPVLAGYEKGLRLQFFLSRQARYSVRSGRAAGQPDPDARRV